MDKEGNGSSPSPSGKSASVLGRLSSRLSSTVSGGGGGEADGEMGMEVHFGGDDSGGGGLYLAPS